MGYVRRILCSILLVVIPVTVYGMQQAKPKPVVRHAVIMYEKETGTRVLAFYDQQWHKLYREPYEGSIEIIHDLSRDDQERLMEMMSFRLSSIEDWTGLGLF